MTAVLECRDLHVRFKTLDGVVHAVNGVSLELNEGECLGIVGESGSGKSQMAMAIMGLLPTNGIATGSVKLDGAEILNAPRKRLNEIRGNDIAMIFQDPMSSLTPFLTVGRQLIEGLVKHKGVGRAEAKARAIEYLTLIGIPAPARRFEQYPHELSGGMRQRVMIAQAMLCRPSVVIADEPTTALDVTVQSQIIDIFRGLRDHTETSMIVITHDLGVIAGLCDRVCVMYGGRIVETGTTEEIFYDARHPYTQGLLASMPRLDRDPDGDIQSIVGHPPHFLAAPHGCSFADRCRQALERCAEEEPATRRLSPTHHAACHLIP